MLDLPANLIAEKNKLHSASPWIVLLEITLTDDTIIRLCRNNDDIIFGGNTYTKFAFQMGMVESNIEGQIPLVNLKVSNITKLLQPYVNDLDGGLGSTVKMTVVNTGLLTEDYTDLEMTFTVLGCEVTAFWVNWTLGIANPLNKRFPKYRYIATHCPWDFGSVECGYTDIAFSDCDHTLVQCLERGRTSTFGGNLGMKSGGIVIV